MTKGRIRFGIIAAMVLCSILVLFRKQIAVLVAMCFVTGSIIVSGRAPFCTLAAAIRSYSFTVSQNERARENIRGARLIERDSAGYELYEVAAQHLWVPTGSSFSILFDLAEQQGHIYDQQGIGARAGDIVLDIGASVGLYAREALKNGAAKVVAIEPAPANLECLRRNLRHEISAGKVLVYPKGAWDKDASLDMQVDPLNQHANTFVLKRNGAKNVIQLPLTTVDSIVSQLKLEKVDFIKMDIEGSERKAIVGASDTIRKYRPRMAISVYHIHDDPVVIPSLILSIQNSYRTVTGFCICTEHEIKPEVYFFDPGD